MVQRAARITIALLIGALILGCSAGPDDVIGTWVLESTRKQHVSELRAAAATIVIRRDGTFSALEVPEELITQGMHPFSGSGLWTLGDRGGGQRVILRFQEVNAEPKAVGSELMIDGGLFDTEIYFYQGDPDLNNRISFQKRR